MIIGCGTGRCGTMSLARLLNSQDGADVTHERFRHRVPWADPSHHHASLLVESAGRYGGDVAFYWLNHLDYILGERVDAQVVILKRPKEATVASYLDKTPGRNHWQEGGPSSGWDHCYPSFLVAKNKADAIARYWKFYYYRANVMARRWSRVRIWSMDEALNDADSQRDMLEWLGFKSPNLRPGIRHNATPANAKRHSLQDAR